MYSEARRYAKGFSDSEIRVSAAVGGMDKYTQIKELKAGAEVVIATPGRLIDLIRAKANTLQQVCFPLKILRGKTSIDSSAIDSTTFVAFRLFFLLFFNI